MFKLIISKKQLKIIHQKFHIQPNSMHSNQHIDTFRQHKDPSVQHDTFASFGPGQNRSSTRQYQRIVHHSVDVNPRIQHLQRCNCENQENILKNREKVYNCEVCNRLRQVCPYTTKSFCQQCFKGEAKGSQINNPYIRIQESNVNLGFKESINTNAPSYSNSFNHKVPLETSNIQKFNQSVSTKVPLQRSMLYSTGPMVEQIIFYPVIHNRFVRMPAKNKLQLRNLRNSLYQKNELQQSIKIKQFQSDKKHKKRKIFNTQIQDSNRKSFGLDGSRNQGQYHPTQHVQINGFLNRISPGKSSH